MSPSHNPGDFSINHLAHFTHSQAQAAIVFQAAAPISISIFLTSDTASESENFCTYIPASLPESTPSPTQNIEVTIE
jgi:hypothetical protein